MRINTTHESSHQVTTPCWWRWWQHLLISYSSASISEKTLMQPLIYSKQTLPAFAFTAILKSFRCHANNPPKHKKQWAHPDEISAAVCLRLSSSASWAESVAQEKLRGGNEASIAEKVGRLVSWLLAFLYKARKKLMIHYTKHRKWKKGSTGGMEKFDLIQFLT